MVLCGGLYVETHAQSSHWQFDAYAYRYDMTAYVSLSIDGEIVTDYSDYEIAAFCGEECRGIASIQKVEKEGTEKNFGYLRIRSNQDTDETITFKVFKMSTNQEMNVYNTSVVFRSQQLVGMPSTPMILPIVHFSVSVSCDETLGTVSGGGVYVAGSTATLTASPIEGYHFVSWSDDEQSNPYEFAVTEDVSLSASFAPNQYTMTFVLDNGEENVEKTQDYGTELTAPEDLVKTGFTFKGWEPEVPATIPAGDQTFTAQWERNKYKLTFVVDDVETITEVLYEDPITKPEDPEEDGYTFIGWTPEVPETMPAEDVTCTAQFQVNQYTMTFVLDNGEENMEKKQDYGTELTAPENLVKTGFTFKGWELEVPATIPAGDQTFTAQWERNKYKLTFVVGGVETTTEVLYEDPITKPEDPKKEGYTFNGWDKDIPAKMPAEDVTITAQWAIITYTISYDLAGGELAEDVTNPTSYTVESDDITLANPTHEKYTFAGWTGTDLAEPTLEVKIAKGSIGNRSYTAIWNTTISIDKTTIDSNTVNVYDLHGRIVRRNVPISMLSKELPRGIYIIGGKKVVITK